MHRDDFKTAAAIPCVAPQSLISTGTGVDVVNLLLLVRAADIPLKLVAMRDHLELLTHSAC